MSVGRCGYCGAPTMTGAICPTHWARLVAVLDRAASIAPVLEQGAAKGGESVVRSTTVGLPISLPVMDARTALTGALAGALRMICPGVPRLVVRDAVRLLRAHEAALRGSWVAPALLVELDAAVAAAVAAVDTPRGRQSVPGECRQCGPSSFDHVGGMRLRCWRCGEQHSVGEVRRAG
ncbi:hypothetical protein NLU66_16700 [Brachybacterium sp. NBEC-018]|uniref:hypothetical protein n=1 Tax=Brachybacterium sp. NBEC-018 TaxID=2996004 RepID=UPI0021755DFF|nr:hypothetical protein [Brachybacterium sp. NBEC-018]UVY83828.1 hypothetical protein NLU66_16700 [Brachybacterium sp. NBEC-018]